MFSDCDGNDEDVITKYVRCYYPTGSTVWIEKKHLMFSDCDGNDEDVITKYVRCCCYPTGSTVWIEREHLAFSDSDDDDEDVMIIMSSATAHGQLLVGEPARIVSLGDIFTQADINSGFLRYEMRLTCITFYNPQNQLFCM